ncbi:MAG: BON domain-containing protein [Gammaproteobacteria bacterium]|nr:MAG: BON domain-containing protein [Gammaproteobacteria bacterium]
MALGHGLLILLSTLAATQLAGCVTAAATGTAAAIGVAHDRRTAGTVIDDEAIELKAAKRIFEDPELREKVHINVTSYNYQVLVSGEAPTRKLADRVIQLVRTIPKVRRVYDEIAIAAPSAMLSRSSDSLITAKVKTALFGVGENFDPTRVKVVTERGIVYLMGIVTREEGEKATEAARHVGGVQKVVKLFEYLD